MYDQKYPPLVRSDNNFFPLFSFNHWLLYCTYYRYSPPCWHYSSWAIWFCSNKRGSIMELLYCTIPTWLPKEFGKLRRRRITLLPSVCYGVLSDAVCRGGHNTLKIPIYKSNSSYHACSTGLRRPPDSTPNTPPTPKPVHKYGSNNFALMVTLAADRRFNGSIKGC